MGGYIIEDFNRQQGNSNAIMESHSDKAFVGVKVRDWKMSSYRSFGG